MKAMETSLAIIGGGSAGLAAAIAAYDAGIKEICVIERESELGGILNQCIHTGFGLHTFSEELTGPEYAARYIAELKVRDIPYLLDTTVLDLNEDKTLRLVNPQSGLFTLSAKAVVLAMGCRERPRGALPIYGTRPAGVLSAGQAQRMVNIEGKLPGRNIIILGSGDIGLIMARRLSLEGANVLCVAEIMPHPGGLKRNIVQCLEDFDIPLLLSHTVTAVYGKDRVEGVDLSQVDEAMHPISGTEVHFGCDTLLLSVGLLPENELSRSAHIDINPITRGPYVNESLETSVPGIFAAGNVLHVHDLVDFVSTEAKFAGIAAARYILSGVTENDECPSISIVCKDPVRYSVPSTLRLKYCSSDLTLRFRVSRIVESARIFLESDGRRIAQKNVTVALPSEMQEICLKVEKLESLNVESELTLGIEER